MGKVHWATQWAAELLTLSTKIKELTNKTPWDHLCQGLQNRWELAHFNYKTRPTGQHIHSISN